MYICTIYLAILHCVLGETPYTLKDLNQRNLFKYTLTIPESIWRFFERKSFIPSSVSYISYFLPSEFATLSDTTLVSIAVWAPVQQYSSYAVKATQAALLSFI